VGIKRRGDGGTWERGMGMFEVCGNKKKRGRGDVQGLWE